MRAVRDDDAFASAHHKETLFDYRGDGGLFGDDHADREKGWKGRRPWDRDRPGE